MACPDEITLDLWLAHALPPDEAAAIAPHVRACADCRAAEHAAQAFDVELHAALALDPDEVAYVSRLELASNWRADSTTASAWGWIALVGVVTGFAAWLVAAPMLGAAVGAVMQVGMGSLLVSAALGLLFDLGQALLDLSRNPALGLSQPLLALLALALLAWPHQLMPRRSTDS